MQYEEEWAEGEEEGEDIGGIWQVVSGKKTEKRRKELNWTGKNSRRTFASRWEELEGDGEKETSCT